MLIAIPSKGRAGSTKSDKILKGAKMFVPESEVHQYRNYCPNVVGVPNSVKGITTTRNWILENANDSRVVFIDDDVKSAGYIQLGTRAKYVKVTDGKVWEQEFAKWFDLCDQMDYKIWGLKSESARRSTYPYKPFLFRTYATASCMGIVNDGSYRFNEEYLVKEDYDICLRHIKERGGLLGVRYMHWENEHWGTNGGCKDYRTMKMEEEAIAMLRKDHPGMVRMAKREAGAYTIQLNL
jgi:hypothetical protein